jgi:hypothetical protein
MKKFFALCILLIGLVAMPPGPMMASSIDHQITFVADVGHVAPVAKIQEIGGIEFRQVSVLTIYNQLDADLPDSNLLTDEIVMVKLPAVPMIYVDRLCQLYLAANQKPPNLQGLQSNQRLTINPIEIRADSQI